MLLRVVAFSILLGAPRIDPGLRPPRARLATVSGVVFDSVSSRPLVDAVVELASTNENVVPRADTTDQDGHFAFANVSPGTYLIGVRTQRLSELGIAVPARAIEVRDGTDISLHLATPSALTMRRALCGREPDSPDNTVLLGNVRDGDSGNLHAGASISASWPVLVVERGGVRTTTQTASVKSSTVGDYVLCAVPKSTEISFEVASDRFRPVALTWQTSDDDFVRRDVRLVRDSLLKGPGTIRGMVVADDSSTVKQGYATIQQLGMSIPVTAGRFTIAEVPVGTWRVDIRAIGYVPLSTLVDASADTVDATDRMTDPMRFTVTRNVPELEAVKVSAQAGRNTKILNEVTTRHRASGGTIFLPGNPALAAALWPSDVLRAARGFHPYQGNCKVSDMTFFLNGEIWGEGAMSTPQEWQRQPVPWQPTRGCATVVVWTRTP